MTKPILLILVGPSGSGKSTFTNSLVTGDSNWITVSRDSLRKALFSYTDSDLSAHYTSKMFGKREQIISQVVSDLVNEANYFNQNVVLDATHLNMKYINRFLIWNQKFDIKVKLFDTDMKTCIQRDQQRQAMVGKDVIKRQFESLDRLINNQDFLNLYKRCRYEA